MLRNDRVKVGQAMRRAAKFLAREQHSLEFKDPMLAKFTFAFDTTGGGIDLVTVEVPWAELATMDEDEIYERFMKECYLP